jgi:flagellar basal body rod protein FlgG
MEYTYLGDRYTDLCLKRQSFSAVRRPDGKCIRGRNGAMLITDERGRKYVVIGRLLRKKTRL